MVPKAEKKPSSHLERFISSIPRTIQVHVRSSSRSFYLARYGKEVRRELQRICNEMEGNGITSAATPTHREINSYFVDTFPSSYYDMLIGNAFLEFGDLLYAVGRIEYGIKKGRIASTRARVPEHRRNVVDKHIRATSYGKGSKRKFNEEEKVVKNLSHSP